MSAYRISYKKPEHGVQVVEADVIDFLNMDTYAFKAGDELVAVIPKENVVSIERVKDDDEKTDYIAEVTAVEMARDAGIGIRRFRRALRKAKLDWHVHETNWTVAEGSPEHEDMIRVLRTLLIQ